MENEKTFRTLKGYTQTDDLSLSTAMEDYLEMICRMVKAKEPVRIKNLSENLNVKPSSASKMVAELKEAGYLSAEKYGEIRLCKKGEEMGAYLLYRHDVIHRFLCVLNHKESELEQAEKIEHFLTPETVENLSRLIPLIENIPIENT